jgi:hypothetical protein
MSQTGGKKSVKKSVKKVLKKKPVKKVLKKVLKKKKVQKGGDGPIPEISSGPISSVQGGINGAIGSFSSFMAKLDQDYEKSLDVVKSIKIGNQRLIQEGGKKKVKKSSTKSTKKSTKKSSTKKSTKKSSTKKSTKKSKKQKGGDGSDFATTLSSRGPSNAPDDYWGVPGQTWFRQFNKTGEYIPNSQLAQAATPSLIGQESSCVSGYDEMDLNYPAMA